MWAKFPAAEISVQRLGRESIIAFTRKVGPGATRPRLSPASYAGLAGLKNGALLSAAEEAGFEVIITQGRKVVFDQEPDANDINPVVFVAQHVPQSAHLGPGDFRTDGFCLAFEFLRGFADALKAAFHRVARLEISRKALKVHTRREGFDQGDVGENVLESLIGAFRRHERTHLPPMPEHGA